MLHPRCILANCELRYAIDLQQRHDVVRQADEAVSRGKDGEKGRIPKFLFQGKGYSGVAPQVSHETHVRRGLSFINVRSYFCSFGWEKDEAGATPKNRQAQHTGKSNNGARLAIALQIELQGGNKIEEGGEGERRQESNSGVEKY